MQTLNNETDLSLFFPKSIMVGYVIRCLEIIYPGLEFRFQKENKDEIIGIDKKNPKNKIALANLSLHGYSDEDISFKIEREEGWIRIICNQNIYDLSPVDPFFRLCQQFDGKFIFDFLDFIDEIYYEESFKAIGNLLADDHRAAALNLGIVSEHFGKKIYNHHFLQILHGCPGIVKVRELICSKSKWSDLINTNSKIKDFISFSEIERDLMESLFYGNHELRILRNKALHPDVIITPAQVITMLSLLISLQSDLRELYAKRRVALIP